MNITAAEITSCNSNHRHTKPFHISLKPLLVSRKKGDRQVSMETRERKLKAINSLKFHDRGHTVLIIGGMK